MRWRAILWSSACGLGLSPWLATPCLAAAATAQPGAPLVMTAGVPADFMMLTREQDMVVDAYYGGRPIGQFAIRVSPGHVRIAAPERLIAALPGLSAAPQDVAAVRAALSAPSLDTNTRFLCPPANAACPRLAPDVAAVVVDQRHFRMDVVIAPRFLVVRALVSDLYLMPTADGPSLVDSVSAALAGGNTEKLLYSVNNRAVLAWGRARLLTEQTLASGTKTSISTAAVQIDRQNLRYAAGLYYSDGIDLVGRSRIAGLGVASQFDTRMDRDLMTGTPLIVFLPQRARVDLLVSGRLVASHSYEAGNQTLDTSALPAGSYMVEVRIQETGGLARSERHFFTRSTTVPPRGHTVFYVNAGVLSPMRADAIVAVGRTPVALAGVARRMGDHWAWDAAAIATPAKTMAELATTLLSPLVQARVGVLGSLAGDYGVLAQIASGNNRLFNYSIDLRHVHSQSGDALLPVDDEVVQNAATAAALNSTVQSGGTYTQLVGTVTRRMGPAQVGLAASYLRYAGQAANYSIGPSVNWSIVRRQRIQLAAYGSYAQSQRGHSTSVGLRLQLLGRGATISGSAGIQDNSPTADIAVTMQRSGVLGGDLTGGLNAQKTASGTVVQAAIDERSPLGYVSGSVAHRIDSTPTATQYGLNVQTAIGLSGHGLALGARQQSDSMIAITLDGSARNVPFDIIINGSPQGRIHTGGRVLIPVATYRRYRISLRPDGGDLSTYDTRTRTVDVFPGTVAALHWTADRVLAMFGRLVWPDGTPLGDADVATTGAIAATDSRGYFQLQAAGDATLTVQAPGGRICHATLAAKMTDKAYIALGNVPCLPTRASPGPAPSRSPSKDTE